MPAGLDVGDVAVAVDGRKAHRTGAAAAAKAMPLILLSQIIRC